MSMEYVWRNGYRGPLGDANDIGCELESIQEELGSISATAVLDRAKNKNSVLNPFFEWNDTKAAELYRLDQARYLIRMVAVKFDNGAGTPLVTRAFVEIKGEDGPYKSLSVVVQDSDLRAQLIKQAQKDIETFENKYGVLSEIMDLIKPVKARLKDLAA